MQSGTSATPTVHAHDRARRWAQRTWTFGVTAALLATVTVVIVARSTATGASAVPQPAAQAAAAAQPGEATVRTAPAVQYGIIIVADEAQAARIRAGLADGAAFVDPTTSPAVVFDVVAVPDEAAAVWLRHEVGQNNSLLGGTGREPTIFDARSSGEG